MARLKLRDVAREVSEKGWRLESKVYTNLRTEMDFQCPEGHVVQTTFGKWRRKQVCPTCQANPLKDVVSNVVEKGSPNAYRILALDQATGTSGWAVFDDRELVTYGTFNAEKIGKDNVHFRNKAVSEWLLNMLHNWEPDLVVIEDIYWQRNLPNGVISFKILATLMGALINIVALQEIPFEIAHTSSWRSHCNVKGRNRAEKKAGAQRFVKDRYDVTVSTDEADAICIGSYAAENVLEGQVETNTVEEPTMLKWD